MALKRTTRIVIAESGAPWLSLVTPADCATIVLAQTPGEHRKDFGRRVSDRLGALARADIRDIVLVTRPRAHEHEWARARGLLENLAREHDPAKLGSSAAQSAAVHA